MAQTPILNESGQSVVDLRVISWPIPLSHMISPALQEPHTVPGSPFRTKPSPSSPPLTTVNIRSSFAKYSDVYRMYDDSSQGRKRNVSACAPYIFRCIPFTSHIYTDVYVPVQRNFAFYIRTYTDVLYRSVERKFVSCIRTYPHVYHLYTNVSRAQKISFRLHIWPQCQVYLLIRTATLAFAAYTEVKAFDLRI